MVNFNSCHCNCSLCLLAIINNKPKHATNCLIFEHLTNHVYTEHVKWNFTNALHGKQITNTIPAYFQYKEKVKHRKYIIIARLLT